MLNDSIAAVVFISIPIIIHLIYLNSIKFSRKNTINNIVRNHLKRIKSHFNDPDLRYLNYEYELGRTNSINEEVKIKLIEFLISHGFKVNYVESRDGFTYLEIK